MRRAFAAYWTCFVLMAVMLLTGCYGQRTAMVTTLTDERGVPLPHVGVRVFPHM